MKALIADDSAFMRTIIKASLKDIAGLEFVEAENGDVAVELYRNDRFDVVFLDIIMPVKNGIMAMQEIRQINPAAKIVVVSSISQEEMILKAQELNANEFLPKPFQPDQIRTVFEKVIASAAPAPTAVPAVPASTPPVPASVPAGPMISPAALASVTVLGPAAPPVPVPAALAPAPVMTPPTMPPIAPPAELAPAIIQPVQVPTQPPQSSQPDAQ